MKKQIAIYKNNKTIIINVIPTIIFIVCIISIITLIVFKVNKKENYPMTGIVTEVDRKNDIVTIEDFNGNIWEFEGCEDWEENDICSCIMNNKGTENIKDDEIVKVKYSGYFEGWN